MLRGSNRKRQEGFGELEKAGIFGGPGWDRDGERWEFQLSVCMSCLVDSVYIRFLKREYDHGPSSKVKVKCPSIVVSIVHILIAIGRPAPPKVRGLWVR